MNRIAFLHTGAVVIPGFAALASELLADVEVQNLLDDRIVVDLGSGVEAEQIAQRLASLGHVAVVGGVSALVLTCSSISGYAAQLAATIGIPVLRIDEAMADVAVTLGNNIGAVATLATTLRPTVDLIRERASIVSSTPTISEVVVPGAFEAIVAGNSELHDSLVVEAIEEQASMNHVVVLAQASMASAAEQAVVQVPVLTSPRLGIERLAQFLA